MSAIDPYTERFVIIGWTAFFQFVPPDARPHLLRPICRSFASEAEARAWLAEVRATPYAATVEIASCVVPVRRRRPYT
jgi:hypothetical protein